MSASTVCMHVCGEMKGLQTEGEEDEDGLIKCYSVLLWYSHHLPHRSGCAATACGPHRKQTGPLSSCQLFPHTSLSNWNIGVNWMENHSDRMQIQFCFQICGGSNEQVPTWEGDKGTGPACRPCEDATGRGEHQLAGKLTTNTYA